MTEAFRRETAFLKSTGDLADLHARGMPFPGGLLVPVCELHADDRRLVATLARWRADNASAFPTQFEVTDAGTARWLRRAVLDAADRILFLVLDRHGHAAGHLGFVATADGLEVDNVVRGEPRTQPGLMSKALARLLEWGEEMFSPRAIWLRVFEDNERAVRFYERLGFRRAAVIPLRRDERPDGSVAYVEDPAGADRRFARMVYRPARRQGTLLTAGPSISAREASYALDAVRNGWNDRFADYHDAFAAAFARYVGVRYALPTSSGTGALHLALLALGVGPGDEVIVPDLTWVATANAVAYTGATPVFADVDERSWCLDPAALEAAITPRTRAVMPVHLYGHPARMSEICRIAREHDLRIVEDAAPAIGAETAGRRAGTFGDAAAFSFQGAKLLVTGEGGMLVTDDRDVYERARYLWGMGHEGDFWIGATGWKYRLSNVQAAIGLGQLERVDELVAAKRRIFSWYAQELDALDGATLNHEAPWARSIYWMTSIRVARRDAVRAALRAAGIDTRPVFPAISRYPIWSRRQLPAPVADRIGREGINLPSGVRLRRADVERVCDALRGALRAARKAA